MSGQRVKGREAIACDAVGALDALATSRTIGSEEDGFVLPGLRTVGPVVISSPLLAWPGVRRRAAKAEPALTPGPAPRSGAA